MASREAIALLVQGTLVASAAMVLVLLVRQPLRRAFGARVAYAAWWLVPAALLALAIPAPPAGGVSIGSVFGAPIGVATGFAGSEAGFDWQPWALGGWACGAIAFAFLMAAAQARFRAALGALRPLGDAWRAEHAAERLPATVGVLVPRIVLPMDFEARYDVLQRDLVLAHERTHVARGDARANLAAAALRCLCWFDPLVHVAARYFRHDQELACDAVVVARYPQLRRAYGDALLNAQCAAQASPLGCHFGFGHPLRERIAMLREPIASHRRRVAGNAAVAVLVSLVAFAAWAAKPHGPDTQDAKAPNTGTVTLVRILPPKADTKDGQAMIVTPPSGYVGEIRMPPSALPNAGDTRVVGKVTLLVDVTADGKVADVEVENSTSRDGRLDAMAIERVRNWKFKPASKDGKPVAQRVRIPVEFR